MKTHLIKLKNIYLRMVLALFVFIAIFLFSVLPNNQTEQYHYQRQDVTEEKFYISKGNRIEQQILFQETYINRIGFCILNKTVGSHGDIEVQLYDSKSDKYLLSEKINVADVTIGKFIWLDVMDTVELGKTYILQILTSELEGELYILARNTENNLLSELTQNATEYGVELSKLLAVNFEYGKRIDLSTKACVWLLGAIIILYLLCYEWLKEKLGGKKNLILITAFLLIIPVFYMYCVPQHDSFHTRLYMLIATFYVILLSLVFYIAQKRKTNIVKLFVIMMLMNGMMYSFVFMPCSQPDENIHFYESYRLSNKMLGQDITDEEGNVLIRECDVQERVREPKDADLRYMLQQIKMDTGSERMVSSDFNGLIKTPIISYIPQAIGITIARLLHFNYFQLFYLGRFANLLFFTVIVAIAIYIIPYGKWQLLVICNLPYLMQLMPSYSYDMLIISGVMLWVAYVLKLQVQEKNITRGQYIILLILGMLVANLKPIYFPLIGLLFIIPNNNFAEKKINAILKKIFLVLLAFLVMKEVYTSDSHFNMMTVYTKYDDVAVSKEKTEENNVDAWVLPNENEFIYYTSYQERPNMKNLVHNPLNFINKIWYSLPYLADWQTVSLFGKYMGSNEIEMPTILIFLIIYLFIREMRNKSQTVCNKSVIICKYYVFLLNVISVFGLLLVSYFDWTSMEQLLLTGTQGRYFYRYCRRLS